jgi:hypothetical protein
MAKTFVVGSDQVRVRSEPNLKGAMIKWLMPGQTIEMDEASRTESDGYVWWKHADGWSAERSVSGQSIFMTASQPAQATPEKLEKKDTSTPAPSGAVSMSDGLPNVNTLPMRDSLFKRLPVDLEQILFWQYYGNNVFSHNLWRDGKQWYAFSQGLHAGLDFGNSATQGVPVYAGVKGTFERISSKYYRPNGLRVKAGDYTVIYGHLDNPRPFQVGQPISPDTVMGELEFRGQDHLHLEVRYQGRWIINPLLLMPSDMRDALVQKFPPSEKYFFKSGNWTQWQKPLDQPVLVLGGGLIGPHA